MHYLTFFLLLAFLPEKSLEIVMPIETVTVNGMSYGPTTSISPSGSPFTWTNNESTRVMVYISAGTVTTISCAPDGLNFITAGLLGGQFHLNPGQAIKVVYLLAPTMNYHPV